MPDATATIELLERLIAFPTVSSASNLDLIDFIKSYLVSRGAKTWRFPDPTGTKASLFASIGDGESALLLSGHTDVVPVQGQAWSADPFRLLDRAGRLYGRGAADMKGFLACMLTAADAVARGTTSGALQLAFSYDEEIGCKGVDDLLAHVSSLERPPHLCIVGEPTEMQLVVGHKSKIAARVQCTGVPGHSSDPTRGISAIDLAADVIAVLHRYSDALRTNGPFAPGFDPPHSTLNIGRIDGGSQVNVIAEHCVLEFEIRGVPGVDLDTLVADIADECSQLAARCSAEGLRARIAVDATTRYPGLENAVEQLRSWESVLGHDGQRVAYGTEAGLFSALGSFPVVVCGPGSINQAHKPDEYVEIEQLRRCNAFLSRLMGGSNSPCADEEHGSLTV